MRRINYKSDIPPLLLTLKVDENQITVPDCDFIVRFYIDGYEGRHYDCSHIGGVWSNCEPSEDGTKLVCYINNQRLGIGELCAEFHYISPDRRYSDGSQKSVVIIGSTELGVELVEDNGDAVTEAAIDVTLPFIYRTAYEIARDHGYTGTAEDFYGALASVVGIADAEKKRVTAEITRNANEQERIENEENRLNAESDRVNAEDQRVRNEAIRGDAESDRVEQEEDRKAKFGEITEFIATVRANEGNRESNERERQTNEDTRITEEAKRVDAEKKRAAEFEQQKLDLTGKIDRSGDEMGGDLIFTDNAGVSFRTSDGGAHTMFNDTDDVAKFTADNGDTFEFKQNGTPNKNSSAVVVSANLYNALDMTLESMGSALDGDAAYRAEAGDKIFNPDTCKIQIYNSNIGGFEDLCDPIDGKLYANKMTGYIYRWDTKAKKMVFVGGVKAYTKDEADSRFAKLDDATQRVKVKELEANNSVTAKSMWIGDEGLLLGGDGNGHLTVEQDEVITDVTLNEKLATKADDVAYGVEWSNGQPTGEMQETTVKDATKNTTSLTLILAQSYNTLESEVEKKVNKTDIVQSTGTSTTAVMSQKAVSDAITAEETRAREAEENLVGKVTELETNTSLTTFIKSQEAASLKYSFKAGRIYRIYSEYTQFSSTRDTESGTTIDNIGEINGSVIFIPTADAKYLRIGVQNPLSNTIQVECISQSVKDLFDSYEKLRNLRGIVAEIKGVFNNRITAIEAGLTTGDSFVFIGGTTDFWLGTFISPTEASYITLTEDSLFIFNNKLYTADVANRKIIPIKGMVVEIKGIFGGIQPAISAGLTTGDSFIYKSLTSIELGTFISSDKASYVTLTEQNNNDWLFILNNKLCRVDIANKDIVPIDNELQNELHETSVEILGSKIIISNSHYAGTSYPYNFVKGKKYSVLVKNSGNDARMGLRTNPDGPSYQEWTTVDGVPHTFVAENDYSYLRAGLFNNTGSIEVIEVGKLDEINIEIANLKTRNIISKLAYSESERITITDELDGFVFNPTEEHNIFCADFFDRLITKFDELCSKHSNAITKYDSVSFVNESLQTPLVYPQYTKLNGQASGIYLATPSYTIPIYKIGMLTSDEMNANKVNIVLIAGLHGWEISSPFNSYVFARHLLEASTGNYAKLLQSANIYILPLLNVYGCYHGYYVNANGVNINRNYPYDGWTPIEGTVPFDSQYAGTEAGSEFETQLTMAILNKIKPQIALDMHGNGADSYYVYLSNPSYGQAFSANDLLADYTRLCQTEYPQFFGTEYKPLWNSSSLSIGSNSLNGGRYLDTWIWKNICQIGGTFEVNLSIFHKDGVRDVNTYRSEFMGKNAVTLNEWQLRNFISKLWNLLPQ